MSWQNQPPRNPDYSQRIINSFEAQSFMNYLGATLQRVEHGHVDILLPKNTNLNQQHGFFHGGVIASIADSTAGYAALTTYEADCGILTSEFKINFLNPAKGNFLLAKGKVIRPGKSMTVCQADIYNDENKHIATALLTMVSIKNLKN